MRKNDYITLGIIIAITLISILNVFCGFLNQYILLLVLLVITIISWLLLGFQKNKSIIEKDIIITTVIYLMGYYIISSLLGLFIGFNKNIYSMTLKNIILNTFPVIALIIVGEVLRYVLMTRAKYNKILTMLLVVAFISFQNTITLYYIVGVKDFRTMFLIEQFGLFIIPNAITNIFLTYQITKVGYKANIVYRLLMEVPLYIIPIFPKFGNYIDSIIRITIPALFMVWLYKYIQKRKTNRIITIRKKGDIFFYLGIFTICLVMIYFVCGFFRYQAYVIASGSMIPQINIGDVVIIDKDVTKDIESLKVGDVVAYQKGNIILCHRITAIINSGKSILFETKGDNNDVVDQLLVREDQILGLVKTKVKYIGYPTVWLNKRR